ncbi:MAG TPA: RHS repeat-associated core domain-containing protein, partial [Candidatus Binatia bacterium]|nr:RHS repeat-associated core domain-containing protein [Candidatus Binatia bacterium]
AFGKRRVANWTTDGTKALLNAKHAVDRGFTFHEHLDHVELIHMNGRVYDPLLGRFLSPDPNGMPFSTQGLDRYGYAGNNPLNRVDPSGYRWHPKWEGRARHFALDMARNGLHHAPGANYYYAYKDGGWNGVAGVANTQGINSVLAYYEIPAQVNISYTYDEGWGVGAYYTYASEGTSAGGLQLGVRYQSRGRSRWTGEVGYAYVGDSGFTDSVFLSWGSGGYVTVGAGFGYTGSFSDVRYAVAARYSQTYHEGRRIAEDFDTFFNLNVADFFRELPTEKGGRYLRPVFQNGGYPPITGFNKPCSDGDCPWGAEQSALMVSLDYALLHPTAVFHDYFVSDVNVYDRGDWQFYAAMPIAFILGTMTGDANYLQEIGYYQFMYGH